MEKASLIDARYEFAWAQINAVRGDGGRPDKFATRIAATILQCEERAGMQHSKTRGFFFTSDEGTYYFFDGTDRKIYKLFDGKSPDVAYAALLARRFGLRMAEPFMPVVFQTLVSFASSNSIRPRVRRFSYYDFTNRVLYLSKYNGMVYRVDGEGVIEEPNGANVFFIDDDGGTPSEADIGEHGLFRKTLVDDINFLAETSGGLTVESQRLLFDIWLHVIPFAELLPGKPIAIFEGEKGSGKTISVKRAQAVIMGNVKPFPLAKSADEEDLAVMLLRSRIALLDNVDSWVEWLPDALAAYATGAIWTRRARYTDIGASAVKPESFIAVTSRDPRSLYRDDVADRSIVFRLDRRTKFMTEGAMFRKLDELRPKLYGEWLAMLSIIVSNLHEIDEGSEEDSRMADFGLLARVVGRALGYEDAAITYAFTQAQVERDEFMVENDVVIELIEAWLKKKGVAGTEFTAGQLHNEWKNLGGLMGAPEYRMKSAKALGRYLQRTMPGLKRRFDITTKLSHNAHVYIFSQKRNLHAA